MLVRFLRIIAALTGLMALVPAASEAAGTTIRAKFSFDGIATCTQPALTNFPVHVDGTGELSTDRTATLTLSSVVGGQENYTAKLGGRPISLRWVACCRTLARVKSSPQRRRTSAISSAAT